MLHKPERALCLGCHDDLAAAAGKPGAVVHQPVRESCLACHRGHGATEASLLRDAVPRLCLKCHDATRPAFAARHGGFDASAARCTGCHEPHVGAQQGLVRAQRHPPFEDGSCQACHYPVAPPPAPPAATAPMPGGVARCADCHEFGELTGDPKAHEPVRRGECFRCHAPHASAEPHLLQARPDDLCHRCHELGASSFRASHERRMGASCTGCHRPHAQIGRAHV